MTELKHTEQRRVSRVNGNELSATVRHKGPSEARPSERSPRERFQKRRSQERVQRSAGVGYSGRGEGAHTGRAGRVEGGTAVASSTGVAWYAAVTKGERPGTPGDSGAEPFAPPLLLGR